MSFQYLIIFNILISLSVIESSSINFVDSNGVLKNLTSPQQIDSIADWAAWASYDNSINKTGWAQLEINSNALVNDSLQAYSSGLIEGYLTSQLIDYHWKNVMEHYCDNSSDYCNKLFKFIEENIEFTKFQIEKYGESDPYWHQIELSLIQVTGIEDGYKAVRNGVKPLGHRIDINSSGLILLGLDLISLEIVLNRTEPQTTGSFDDHCSAIVKVSEDGSDLFFAHNTWLPFSWMVRIVKRYNLNYRGISGKSVSFSSYPGIIHSLDDYYLISSGLAVSETTIYNFNNTLWKYVGPEKGMFGFLRNTVANRLARNAKEWTQLFSKYNSGTDNSQFLILDFNKFKRGVNPSNLSNDLLWVLEQMPGNIMAEDVTHVLREQHYWPSYNIAYFPLIYQLSGYGTMAEKYGDFFTYNKTARALIFKRDHKNITDLSSFYKFMRYNDFKHDPLSKCNCTPPYSPKYAIAARCDLGDPNGTYPLSTLGFRDQAAIDVKLTNSELFTNLEMIANNGPTYDSQPPFQWSTTKIKGVPHYGQPDLFKFPGVQVKWSPLKQIPINF